VDDVAVTAEPPSSGPTSVKVTSFTAARVRESVALSWRTANESDTLGFNVWRFTHGNAVKVNPTLVRAHGGTTGATYRLLDRAAYAGAHTYRLQAVSLKGVRSWLARTQLHLVR
jgi:hypothetical protein